MRITEEQENILNKLICERFKDNPESAALIQNFQNHKGDPIVNYMKRYGLQEDKEGNTAFYLVRTPENEVLLFFSLKCGVLFKPFDEALEAGYQDYLLLLQDLQNGELDPETHKQAISRLKDLSARKQIPLARVVSKLDDYKLEKDTESNEHITRVSKTFPGVELVHFCRNDCAKETWKSYGLNHPMGEVIFWKIIAPKIFEIQKLVGCEYLFLFAADLSEDRTLQNYYSSLRFENNDEIGTNKPYYDFACLFMCQSLASLKHNQRLYFDNFNIDDIDDVV